jgi:hypothetical protein
MRSRPRRGLHPLSAVSRGSTPPTTSNPFTGSAASVASGSAAGFAAASSAGADPGQAAAAAPSSSGDRADDRGDGRAHGWANDWLPSGGPPHRPPPVTAEHFVAALIAQAAADLERTASRRQLSRTDVVNRAVTLYEFIDAELFAGAEFILRRRGRDHRLHFF